MASKTPTEVYIEAVDSTAREHAVVIGQVKVGRNGLIDKATLTAFTVLQCEADSRLASMTIGLTEADGKQTLTVRPGCPCVLPIGRQGHPIITRGYEEWVERLSQQVDMPTDGCLIAVTGRQELAHVHNPQLIALIGQALAVESAYQQRQAKVNQEYLLLMTRLEELLNRGRLEIAARLPI